MTKRGLNSAGGIKSAEWRDLNSRGLRSRPRQRQISLEAVSSPFSPHTNKKE